MLQSARSYSSTLRRTWPWFCEQADRDIHNVTAAGPRRGHSSAAILEPSRITSRFAEISKRRCASSCLFAIAAETRFCALAPGLPTRDYREEGIAEASTLVFRLAPLAEA